MTDRCVHSLMGPLILPKTSNYPIPALQLCVLMSAIYSEMHQV